MEGAFFQMAKRTLGAYFQYYVCVALLSYHSPHQKTIVFPLGTIKNDGEMKKTLHHAYRC